MPLANWCHYEDTVWVVQFFGWPPSLPPPRPHYNNESKSKHLLSSYYVLNTVPRALHGLPHFQQFSADATINYN